MHGLSPLCTLQELMQCMESSRITLAGDASILTLQAAGEFILAGTSHGEVCVARWKDRDLQQAGMLKGHSKAVRGKPSFTFVDLLCSVFTTRMHTIWRTVQLQRASLLMSCMQASGCAFFSQEPKEPMQ